MIFDERTVSYLSSLEPDYSPVLSSIEEEAIRDGVPIIRRETGSLLRCLIRLTRPESILEVGTATGFSALLMSEEMPAACTITTIEKYEKRIPAARANFERAGMSDRIRLIEGDAALVLKELEGPFDMIFMDAAKGQYIHFLPDVLRLLSTGGLLISDNILQDGQLVESRYGVTRRNRTIHARMREYLHALKHNDQLQTTILTVGDGMSLSVKLEPGRE